MRIGSEQVIELIGDILFWASSSCEPLFILLHITQTSWLSTHSLCVLNESRCSLSMSFIISKVKKTTITCICETIWLHFFFKFNFKLKYLPIWVASPLERQDYAERFSFSRQYFFCFCLHYILLHFDENHNNMCVRRRQSLTFTMCENEHTPTHFIFPACSLSTI